METLYQVPYPDEFNMKSLLKRYSIESEYGLHGPWNSFKQKYKKSSDRNNSTLRPSDRRLDIGRYADKLSQRNMINYCSRKYKVPREVPYYGKKGCQEFSEQRNFNSVSSDHQMWKNGVTSSQISSVQNNSVSNKYRKPVSRIEKVHKRVESSETGNSDFRKGSAAYLAPILLTADQPAANLIHTTVRGFSISGFNIGGELRLCLPQILNTVLDSFSVDEIRIVYDRLRVYCALCTTTQLNALKNGGVLPSNATSCGLITKTDVERLCSALIYSKCSDSVRRKRAGEMDIRIMHECFGSCVGIFHVDDFISEDSAAVSCVECGNVFSPAQFVSHTHTQEECQTVHWGFDSSLWRLYVGLDEEFYEDENISCEWVQQRLDAVKNIVFSKRKYQSQDDRNEDRFLSERSSFKRQKCEGFDRDLDDAGRDGGLVRKGEEGRMRVTSSLETPGLAPGQDGISQSPVNYSQSRSADDESMMMMMRPSMGSKASCCETVNKEVKNNNEEGSNEESIIPRRGSMMLRAAEIQARLLALLNTELSVFSDALRSRTKYDAKKGKQWTADLKREQGREQGFSQEQVYVKEEVISDAEEEKEEEEEEDWRQKREAVKYEMFEIQKSDIQLISDMMSAYTKQQNELKRVEEEIRMRQQEEEEVAEGRERERERVMTSHEAKMSHTRKEVKNLRRDMEELIQGSCRSDMGLIKAKYKAQAEHFHRKLKSAEQLNSALNNDVTALTGQLTKLRPSPPPLLDIGHASRVDGFDQRRWSFVAPTRPNLSTRSKGEMSVRGNAERWEPDRARGDRGRLYSDC